MKNKFNFQLFPIEKLTLAYLSITFLIGLFFLLILHFPVSNLLVNRILLSVFIIGIAYFSTKYFNKYNEFIRFAVMGLLIAYWYPECFAFNRYLHNHDYILAQIDQKIFGFQPAYLFSIKYPQEIISELMNLGYFSLYLMIVLPAFYFAFYNKPVFYAFTFILLSSFFIYYLIFIFFPAAGPQFYYAVIGTNNVVAGNFPDIGLYFSKHTITPLEGKSGFFDTLVNLAQCVGERPSAAFPSSHVGVSTIVMILLFKNKQKSIFYLSMPFYILLVLSTVYIRAHYAVDVFAGFITAFFVYIIGTKLYRYFFDRNLNYPQHTNFYF